MLDTARDPARQSSSNSKRRRRRVCDRSTMKTSSKFTMWFALSSTIATLLGLALAQTISQVVVVDPSSGNFNATSSRHQIQATFSTPSQSVNITHLTYDPVHDTVYVGATNAIYQLSGANLSAQHVDSTGPVLDSPSCGITDCHGYEDLMKPTPNVNKLLVLDYQHQKVLSCGSTKQGACRRYQLNNLAQKEDLIPVAVAANDDNSSTYAFVGPARYNLDQASYPLPLNNQPQQQQQLLQQQQQVLYVASTYTKVGQSRDLLVPAIGTRTLDHGPNLMKLYEKSFLDSARIDISSHLRDYFLVHYLYGFASSNYIYFVTVQKKATSRDYEELGYHTRLARICITDSSYNSYTEVDLKCVANRKRSAMASTSSSSRQPSFFGSSASQQQQPSEYPLLQDAILVDAGSQLLQSINANSGDFYYPPASSTGAQSDDSKVLLGVFSSARDHTQHPGEHSALCAFSLAQIEEKFNDNIHNCYTGKMQSRNMEYIAGNVQECPKNGRGGNVVDFCHETLKINGTIPIASEASIQYQNTTLTAITATSHVNTNQRNIYSDQLGAELASSTMSARASNLQGANPYTVAFLGTSNGHIKKVLLNNATNGVEFEDVQLDTQPILADLHLHSSGQQLIAATPYKVMKVATHNCSQHSTCRDCNHSRNPYCGWCSLKRSCTTRNECVPGTEQQQQPASKASQQTLDTSGTSNNKQLKWISNDSAGKCIDLQAIVPDKMPISSTGKLDLYIERLPALPKEHTYKCIFDRKEPTTATFKPFGLSCPLPKLMHRPSIPVGRDHAIVDLAVRSSETNTDFLNGKITFFECQAHKTCKDCLTTSWDCGWCLSENICLSNTSKCEKTTQERSGQSTSQPTTPAPLVSLGAGRSSLVVVGPQRQQHRSGNTIKSLHQCPTFDVGHEQSILIADGSERELAIKVKNMPHVKGNIQCYVEIENEKIPLRARIEEDRVVCENSTYTYAADVPQLQGQLVVSYSEQNILIDRTNFTLYKCHLLGAYLNRPDCSLCQRISSRFQCGWCSGACMHRSRCTERPDDTCPPPRIDYVHPLNGPIQGGTKVLIEGSNLGQSIEEVANRVKIGNVPCKLVEEEYRPSNRIVCITGPLVTRYLNNKQPLVEMESSLGDVMVGNRAGYSVSPNKFHFKSVYLRDHQPKYGPQSGGTRVTLSGLNLNIGSSVQVFFDELPCQIEPNQVTGEQIVCKTSPSPQPSRQIRQLKLIVDDLQIIQDDEVFYYIQDPTISKISPLRSYLSGGRPITVYGSNLTSVQLPRMVISDVITGKQINETTCLFLDDTRMRCPSPMVSLPMIELEYSEQHLPQHQHQQQTTGLQLADGESVKFKLNIVMDNVIPAINVAIEYTSDPKLYSFDSQQYKNSSGSSHDQDQPQPGQEQAAYQLDSDTYLLQPTEPMMTLYGEHLQTAVNEYEITVFVGQDVCNLTYWSHTKLVCAMPLDHMASPTDEEARLTQRGLPLVVVRIGYNLRYELGYVMYHPQLADQIRQTQSNSSGNRITQLEQHYRNYVPRENESFLRRMSGYVMTLLLFLLYVALGSILVGLAYASLFLVHKIKKKSYYEHEYHRIQSKMDSLEKSIKTECRVASLALQGDLNELERHVDLSGVPLLTVKQYIMKVFFPGINNHPLLVKSQPQNDFHHNNCMLPEATNATNHQNHLMASIQRPLKNGATSDFPMEYFHRLILNKPFLITFINTLEAQPSFTIRDKVNVASLIMIILMERLDYATDILRTLLFQLVERSASRDRQLESMGALESKLLQGKQRTLSHKASNLIGGLPSGATGKRSSRATTLGKVVNGSASSLMTSTTVAAQMLLSRVGNKTSPLQDNVNANLRATATMGHNMSTTAFNQRSHHNGIQNQRSMMQSSTLGKTTQGRSEGQTHLMLRRTDSVVEKMLTNWLALNMYDYFHGKVGQSLYMMFEALRCQLDRGPIESVSGDAYYSLNEHKLLKEPYIQFEMVNLYIIVDTDILQPHKSSNDQNLLLDGTGTANYQLQFYEDNRSNYTASNTITLSLRVLDCDTVNQVKGKILNALYRNSPNSMRLTVNDVELSLRQQQSLTGQSTLNGGQFVTVTLHDEDYSSITTFNGSKRLNTLRHYGVTDQAIMMLNRINQSNNRRQCSTSVTRTNLTDMLDEHYNNPYSEIQYGPVGGRHVNAASTNSTKWHLVRPDERGLNMQQINGHSNESSPSSQSPSMLLLGHESVQPRQQQQQFYHPSSSSTGSTGTGNVMDTNSTSANSSSINVTNLLMRAARQEQQPIYCQIGSVSGASGRQGLNGGGSSYYCQINNCNQNDYQVDQSDLSKKIDHEQEQRIYLTRMMTSKGTVQSYIDNFFKTILSAKGDGSTNVDYNNMNNVLCGDFSATTLGAKGARNGGACPPAVKWLFDLLDEAAMENGITDPNVIHSWKSNAFLLRFWANFIKNPNYVLDVEKSNTLDASLSVISQTLMDSCSSGEHKLSKPQPPPPPSPPPPPPKPEVAAMRPRAILKHHSNSYPFDERAIDLTGMVKVGRAVAKCKPQGDNAIFDCKVLSRNHAVIWFENGKFFIRDTCSSNGTFINNTRLSPANEDSPGKEIYTNDIIQFGVEVVDSTSKITHGCIILRIKLFYPNGSEASRTATMFNIPTANMLPPYYSYTQMLEREQQIYQKLNSIEEVLEEAHLLVDMKIHAKKEEERLIKQIEELQSDCDDKTNYAQKLDQEIENLKANLEKKESRNRDDFKLIRSLEIRAKQKELEVEHLQKQLDRMIRKDHRLVTTLFLLLLIVLVVGGFDMIVMFLRFI